MYCPNCKQEYDGKFCPECGTKLFEKPAASGVSLDLGDANAISGGLHVSDSHDVHNIQNTSNTTIDNRSSVDNSHTVNNSTVYEAQKTKAEIQQENENTNQRVRFVRMAAREGYPDGYVINRKKIQRMIAL